MDVQSGEVVSKRTGAHDICMWKLVVSSKFIASLINSETTVKIWNMDLEPEQSLEHSQDVWAVDISPNSMMIISGDEGGKVSV